MRKPRILLGLLLATTCAATAQPAGANHARKDGAQQLDEAFAAALKADDVDAAVALYAPDAVLYNLGGPPAVGREAIRAALAGFLAAFDVKEFAHTDGRYVTEGELSTGFAQFAITVAPRAGGPSFVITGRSTTVARRDGGRWRYLHDHASVPQAQQ